MAISERIVGITSDILFERVPAARTDPKITGALLSNTRIRKMSSMKALILLYTKTIISELHVIVFVAVAPHGSSFPYAR